MSLLQGTSTECPICYQTCLDPSYGGVDGRRTSIDGSDEGITNSPFITVRGCGHRFCRTCLGDHCRVAIGCRNLPIPCPAVGERLCLDSEKGDSGSCNNHLDDEQVHGILCPERSASYDEELACHDIQNCSFSDEWGRYRKFRRLQKEPDLLECTRCSDLVSPCQKSILDGGNPSNLVVCSSCSHSFCASHGDCHPGISCIEYENSRGKKALNDERLSREEISRSTKPCSHCGILITLAVGCDHVVCPGCKDDFCFKCGTHVHLTGWGPLRTCNSCGKDYIDHRYERHTRITFLVLSPLWVPLALAWVALMVALVVLSCFCCFCFCGGTFLYDGNVDSVSRKTIRQGAQMVAVIIFDPFLEVATFCGLPCLGWQEELFRDIG